MVKGWGALVGITIIATMVLILIPNTPQAAAEDTICSGILSPGIYENILVPTFCSIRSGVFVNGNVSVQDGATLSLLYTTINGFVELDPNARFLAFGSTINGDLLANDGTRVWLVGGNTIVGNIEATDCFSVGMYNPDSTDIINGNFETDGCNFVRLRNATVGGEVIVRNSVQATTVSDSIVTENVKVLGNEGFVYRVARNTVGLSMEVNDNNVVPGLAQPGFVAGNIITGNLECAGNNPPPETGSFATGTNTVSGDKEGQCVGL